MSIKILADENIPLAEAFFGHLGHLQQVSGRSLTAAQLVDADVLLVRSVTRVDAALLARSPLGFVGTCTIGTDHLDLDYLNQRGIVWANAPGCNANSVVEYVYSALVELDVDWRGASVGIIGCGSVGGLLYRKLRAQGVRCRCYDPYRHDPDSDGDINPTSAPQDNPDLTSLDEVLGCDIVSVHTPLTTSGPYPTRHLLGERELQRLKQGAVLLNCGRGPVIDNRALEDFLAQRPDVRVVLDVWEPEPNLSRPLLSKVALGTPHIAGYSYDGKLRGTEMVYQALCKYLQVPPLHSLAQLLPPMNGSPLSVKAADDWQMVRTLVRQVYAIAADDQRLRELARRADLGLDDFAQGFDHLRKHYPERREFHNYRVSLPAPQSGDKPHKKEPLTEWLAALGFTSAQRVLPRGRR